MNEETERSEVVREALTWQRTPFHDNAGIKGVGSDCAWFPFRVYRAVGVIPEFEVPQYSPQFLLNSSRELYLEVVERHAVEITTTPRPGDFVMYLFGRVYSHGAIALDWPRIIHSRKPVGVTQDDALSSSLLTEADRGTARVHGLKVGAPRPLKFYTLKTWAGVP